MITLKALYNRNSKQVSTFDVDLFNAKVYRHPHDGPISERTRTERQNPLPPSWHSLTSRIRKAKESEPVEDRIFQTAREPSQAYAWMQKKPEPPIYNPDGYI